MQYLYTGAEMRLAENKAIAGGQSAEDLMESAAHAALSFLSDNYKEHEHPRVAILCAGGNNGGDGMALARLLYDNLAKPIVFYCGETDEEGHPDEAKMSTLCALQYHRVLALSIPVLTKLRLDGFHLIVDAMLGIGLSRPVTGKMAQWIDSANQSGLPIIAMDLPTGVDCDTGKIWGCAMKCEHTLNFGETKLGACLYPGKTYCGIVHTYSIGISPLTGDDASSLATALIPSDIRPMLPMRPERSHKGTFGRLFALSGSYGMAGASILLGQSAYRMGVGLVDICTPETNNSILQSSLPSAIVTPYPTEDKKDKYLSVLAEHMQNATAVVMGPGLSNTPLSQKIMAFLLPFVGQKPLLLDADALNILSQNPSMWALVPAGAVITPHMGEAGRLTGKSIDEITANPMAVAQSLAGEHHVICLLKDANTIIVSPDGQKAVNLSGTNALATAGSGDVLSGVIASLFAQGVAPFDAVRLGACLHGMAGRDAALKYGARSVMASDLPTSLSNVLKQAEM